MASFGYWTISNFMRMIGNHNVKCLSRVSFSNMKLMYQICLVAGGMPAMMCLCALSFLLVSIPFLVVDYFRKKAKERARLEKRRKLRKTLFRCNYAQIQNAVGANS